ncbi:hypothetical protein L596_008492 [Steinernema carpocapsae]|uniref:Uncharacterized protein n=1 Tax=Steinernema carpocapsae TaxID=34508 RepID=A0A4U5PCT0_STECR|nr:hypothetical protein L596_008492 [Steinernema carpocapsae]
MNPCLVSFCKFTPNLDQTSTKSKFGPFCPQWSLFPHHLSAADHAALVHRVIPLSTTTTTSSVRPVEGLRIRNIPYGDSGFVVEIDLLDPKLQHHRRQHDGDKEFVAYLAYLADAHYRGYASGRLVNKLFGHLRVGFREEGRHAFNRAPTVNEQGDHQPPSAEKVKNASEFCKNWGIGVTEMPSPKSEAQQM